MFSYKKMLWKGVVGFVIPMLGMFATWFFETHPSLGQMTLAAAIAAVLAMLKNAGKVGLGIKWP